MHLPTQSIASAHAKHCTCQRKALQPPTQSFSSANAKLCICLRKALHLPTQSIAPANAKLCIRQCKALHSHITLLRLQRAWTSFPCTQGAATLYPGLCAAALTARADYCICCKQVVNRNQETTFCKGLRSKVKGLRLKVEGLRSKD